jgi:L-rhamnose mutarotase
MLDLKDDPALIARYEAHHRAVWPEVTRHLAASGVTAMEIYRLGTRLCMVMETDDAVFDAERMARAQREDPRLAEWERTMWTFQAPTAWTPPGAKWVAAQRIFDFDAPPSPG